MANKIVVIVARTKMYGGRVCIGSLSEDGENLRLMNPNCSSDLGQKTPYQVAEKWRIVCEPCGQQVLPHVEDVAVTEAKKLGDVKDLVSFILDRAKPLKGGIGVLFEGKIQFTQNGAGYISKSGVPKGAIGFWIPSSNLELQQDDRGKNGYYPKRDYRHLSYVGVQEPIETIEAGQLVRVSLARWWKPQDADADLEERCYAQLSGWY
jgi:hypothetical protein